MLETGAVATIREIAAKEEINSAYVSRVPRLTLLVPEIVEAILDGWRAWAMMLPASFPLTGGSAHDCPVAHPSSAPAGSRSGFLATKPVTAWTSDSGSVNAVPNALFRTDRTGNGL
jgi:hypothetical protein